MKWAKRGESTPKGYTVRYIYADSDYATTKHKAFVKKKRNTYKHKSLRGRITK